MKNTGLANWICENREKWDIICGISEKRFTLEEVKKLLGEMQELANTTMTLNNEFDAIFTVLISQYYYDLYPEAVKNKNQN